MTNATIQSHTDDDGMGIARIKGAGFALLMLILLYVCSLLGPVGWLTYMLSLPAWMVIVITVIARVNDLSVNHQSAFWNVRRNGLVLSGLFAASEMITGMHDPISWRLVIGAWGYALTLMTSPHLPPWWVYVSKHAHVGAVKQHPQRRETDDGGFD